MDKYPEWKLSRSPINFDDYRTVIDESDEIYLSETQKFLESSVAEERIPYFHKIFQERLLNNALRTGIMTLISKNEPIKPIIVSKDFYDRFIRDKAKNDWVDVTEFPPFFLTDRFLPLLICRGETTVVEGGWQDGHFWHLGQIAENVTAYRMMPAPPRWGKQIK